MKNAFTLIELLSVIIIAGILSSIAFITVDKVIKNGRQQMYDLQINSIYDGAASWVVDNVSTFSTLEEGNFYCVLLSELQNHGYVESNLVNPKTDSAFGDMSIKIEKKQTGFDYSIDENNECEN